jgi:DNA-binding NtrC family response regulator
MAIVLVVDDDPAMREALGEAITDMGHEPRLADSGAAALAALEDIPSTPH